MAYILVNKNRSLNFADEHPVNQYLSLHGVELIEFPDKTLEQVMNGIKFEAACWDGTKIVNREEYWKDHPELLQTPEDGQF